MVSMKFLDKINLSTVVFFSSELRSPQFKGMCCSHDRQAVQGIRRQNKNFQWMDSTTPNKFTTSQRARGMPQIRSGHLLNCILSTFTIKDLCKKVHFEQTRNSGLRKLLLIVSWDLRTGCPFIYVVWEATQKPGLRPLKGIVSAQKVLQTYKTVMR